MRAVYFAVCVVLLCVLAFGCQKQQVQYSALGEQFVTDLSQGDFAKATEQFDANMAQAMTESTLAEAWQGVENSVGKFQSQSGSRVEKATLNGKSFTAVITTCQCERGKVDVKTVYDEQGKISGLWFMPGK